ncbi:MAG: DUF3842 family protein [Solobacterium sp.]|nr:DUF3842 family protein [Solobacterium sp.]
MMRILVIDGQGGRIGRQLVKLITERFPQAELLAVGTNSIATESMIKGGAVKAATGENAVIYNSRRADVIIGPIGIVIADALLGEVTPKMAAAVGSSEAKKILIPMDRCDTLVAGLRKAAVSDLLEDTMQILGSMFD